eukprot:TRINITY_DN5655_c0_g1_i5.p1 TRINITY_DN5655_c0_g1~~TRINITY_DN5655_c0_g1_i5.p1  ORF type:complete len:224 (+),score=30.82 TRINITY_DN5655_c0_g1_i5:657-1328(+)
MESSNYRGFVDFANCFIHIGQIIPSMTQEEVLFSCCPECFVSMLFCEKLEDNEVVVIRGVKRFSDYVGYQFSFKWEGPFISYDCFHDILVMDASVDMCGEQFSPATILRDLNKVYLGFKACGGSISTGHWGCGAFGGDKSLKFLQQLCAATEAKVRLDYSTYRDKEYCDSMQKALNLMEESGVTVRVAYELMLKFERNTTFRKFMLNRLEVMKEDVGHFVGDE